MLKTINMLLLVAAAVTIGSIYVIAVQAKESQATEQFIRNAAIGNQYEIETSKLALDRSKNAEVRKFAEQMVESHGKTGEDFKDALRDAGIDSSMAVEILDKPHQKMLNELKRTGDQEFDEAYVKAQTKAHKEAVKLFKKYADDGDNETLKEFANTTLPVLEAHLESIKEIKAEQ